MMAVGGHLVVAGGYAEGLGHLTSVEAYTPTGWTPLPPLPHAADDATACVLNGRLYVMGGLGCDKLQVLEMFRGKWVCVDHQSRPAHLALVRGQPCT